MVKVSAVVPAAGSGARMGTEVKKQYLSLAGIPVLGHVLKIIEKCVFVQNVVIVAGSGEERYCREAVVEKLGLKKVTAIVPGGKKRQDSVYNGLLALSSGTGVVVVHDGARPILDPKYLKTVVEAAVTYGAATCAVPVKDTVKSIDAQGFVARTIPRSKLVLTQTPQAFRYDIIMEAHRRARGEKYTVTDDAGLVEHLGLPVKIVPGDYSNLKITTPEDLIIASAMLNKGVSQAGPVIL